MSIATYAPSEKTPLWVRLIGGRWYDGGSVRTWWGEFSPKGWGIGFSLGAYDSAHLQIKTIKGQVFIRLPFLDKALVREDPFNDGRHYGATWDWFDPDGQGAIHLNWGNKYKNIYMPWVITGYVVEQLAADGSWVPQQCAWRLTDEERAELPPLWTETHPYHYLLRSGETQHVNATITREKRKLEWDWFGRGPISTFLRKLSPHKWVHTIDIAFDAEVGERAGDWKGGTVGCSYKMFPDETPFAALRRMQGERKFR